MKRFCTQAGNGLLVVNAFLFCCKIRGVVLKKRCGNGVPTSNKKEDCTKWLE